MSLDTFTTSTVLESSGSSQPTRLGGEHIIRAAHSLEGDIIDAISTGAQWEVWLQVALAGVLRKWYGAMGRELRLPSGKSVDLAFTYRSEYYFIELKVESATNAGQFAGVSCSKAVDEDLTKLAGITLSGTDGVIALRGVLVMWYSSAGAKGYEAAAANYSYHLYVPGSRIHAAFFYTGTEIG